MPSSALRHGLVLWEAAGSCVPGSQWSLYQLSTAHGWVSSRILPYGLGTLKAPGQLVPTEGRWPLRAPFLIHAKSPSCSPQGGLGRGPAGGVPWGQRGRGPAATLTTAGYLVHRGRHFQPCSTQQPSQLLTAHSCFFWGTDGKIGHHPPPLRAACQVSSGQRS